jgi:hypothetical protein
LTELAKIGFNPKPSLKRIFAIKKNTRIPYIVISLREKDPALFEKCLEV